MIKILKTFMPLMLAALFSCNNETATPDAAALPVIDTTVKSAAITTADNSANSLDWAGTYKGTVPCADCEGIETTISINTDSSYTLTTKYLGKKGAKTNETKGVFAWNKEGNTIALSSISNAPSQYLVGENMLVQLDMDGKKITGGNAALYQLIKLPTVMAAPAGTATAADAPLAGTYWKLTELMGKQVIPAASTKEIFAKFESEGTKITGNGGCNNFFGTYETVGDYKIKFSKMGSTMMACQKMELERSFLNIFEKADSYIIKGNKLQLVKARMAPLAVFEAVPGK